MGREPLVRVERGRATEEELGALVVVLLVAAQNAAAATGAVHSGPGWCGDPALFRVPHSWQVVP